ncbi:Glutathione S-transferase [Colletotrichum tanaceti]|uniref:glutathione transferase n=1 Tax=Colletotrichum tanaceti TaxID=1306861 RepID=A0A4V6DK87_9PEZI|nr:Glutathione S-transferase [Colletotrichum tanaceti]TKW58446.1 Glutathione S-transferase [Colletotrichum tanaceti]
MSPAFTLYGARGSTCTERVRLTLAEGGFTDYELVLINLYKGEQKVRQRCRVLFSSFFHYEAIAYAAAYHQSEENLKLHPWGKVPVVTFPDGFTLYESRAICKYLAKKYSFPLLPSDSDAEAVALFDQAQSVETLYFADPTGRIGYEKFVKKFIGLPADEVVVSAALRSVEAFFDVAERALQHSDYMAGKDFTLVDINYVPLVQRLFACGYGDLILGRKAVNAWWDRVVNRPAIQQLLAADKEAMAAARG